MSAEQTTTVLSLGAGVQSSTLALLAAAGEQGLSEPDFAVFADTGWEPSEVYEHLDWLETQLGYPVIRTESSSGKSIKENITEDRSGKGYSGFTGVPFYSVNPSNGKSSQGKRQCTTDYKIEPIRRTIRRQMGVEHGQRMPAGARVEMWLGLSTDEIWRANKRHPQEGYTTRRYPLIEIGWTRQDCRQWFYNKYGNERKLPRSACVCCPYRSPAEWSHLARTSPDEFQEAVGIESSLRRRDGSGRLFFHSSLRPINEVVSSYESQARLFPESAADGLTAGCEEGYCGV